MAGKLQGCTRYFLKQKWGKNRCVLVLFSYFVLSWFGDFDFFYFILDPESIFISSL